MTTKVLAIILGGGKGTRLFPLTKERSKPAVPFGGKYRIVDIPISNCINSNILQVYLLTQFNSASLHMHIANAYNFDRFSRGFVEILAAEHSVAAFGYAQRLDVGLKLRHIDIHREYANHIALRVA